MFVSVYFLSVPHLQYQHILLTKFQEMNDIGYMYKQWLKNQLKHKQRAHYHDWFNKVLLYITFPWIWGSTGITFARRKSITIARKIYLRLFFTFARITCYLEYIWFTHNIFCILQHDWRCNMDYSPLWSAFKMKTKNIRITLYKYMKYEI